MVVHGNGFTLDLVPKWAIDKVVDECERKLLDEKRNEPVEASVATCAGSIAGHWSSPRGITDFFTKGNAAKRRRI